MGISNNYINEIKKILKNARQKAYTAVNSAMVEAYWKIGRRIVEEEQNGKERAEYGKEILQNLSKELTEEFGKGYSYRTLREIRQFYLMFSDFEKWRTVSAKLTWSHFQKVLRVSDEKARIFYLTEAAENMWSVRTLDRNISTLYYNRIVASIDKKIVENEMKEKTKKRIKDIARDLIKLYAQRRHEKGYAFSGDSYLQHELEASFLYEDTPDQLKATNEVKADMERARPMDRLVCGDVGFGKTEVAIRAAFKAACDSKQVAVLVPTTVLAFQHYKTFSSRLKGQPVRVDYLSRARSQKQTRQVLEDLAAGKIDILIGTHKLIGKNVKWHDLGLLIIDEEQKFGVSTKEKLRRLKTNVDTLTMSATPIPRTLQFSLMGARDMSIIRTPPPNRYPIDSQVIPFSEEVIRDGIRYEIQRGGQVFFMHNRVENIQEVAGMIQRLLPDARIAIGHGQMDGKKLEETMLAFMEGAYDVLVATTIIESGLDVPNANTIFINNAHNFGLSDLHQMRGRVGRSNKKAFCYFITPPLIAMSDDARKRIEAIAQFSDLGSGLNIAMKDLEIRGAGDLLGGEQSGFINEIGFDTYQKILQEAITELKENEFSELYRTAEEDKTYLTDTQIDTDFELLFPDTYVNRVAERLNLYNELSNLTNEEALQVYQRNLIDRFGKLPPQAIDLLNSVRVKWLATRMGIEKLVMKNGKMTGYFIADQNSPFYQSARFQKLLLFVQRYPNQCRMQEKETRNGLRLLILFDGINTVYQALKVLQQIEA